MRASGYDNESIFTQYLFCQVVPLSRRARLPDRAQLRREESATGSVSGFIRVLLTLENVSSSVWILNAQNLFHGAM